eukprot:gene13973-15430_t
MSKIPDIATRRKPQFIAKTWFRLPFKGLFKYPIEPVSKLFVAVIGSVVELSVSCHWRLRDANGLVLPTNVASYSKATVLFMFGIVGIAEIFESIRKLKFPRSGPFMALALAYLSVGILFSFNVSSVSSDDVLNRLELKFYLLLSCTAFSAFLVTLLETWNMKSFALSFARCFLTVLLGTWLFQTSFALHGPKSWQFNKGNISFVPVVFMWHILGIFLFCMLMHLALSYAASRFKDIQDRLFNKRRDEDSIPLGIVVNGNTLFDIDSSEDNTLYP